LLDMYLDTMLETVELCGPWLAVVTAGQLSSKRRGRARAELSGLDESRVRAFTPCYRKCELAKARSAHLPAGIGDLAAGLAN